MKTSKDKRLDIARRTAFVCAAHEELVKTQAEQKDLLIKEMAFSKAHREMMKERFDAIDKRGNGNFEAITKLNSQVTNGWSTVTNDIKRNLETFHTEFTNYMIETNKAVTEAKAAVISTADKIKAVGKIPFVSFSEKLGAWGGKILLIFIVAGLLYLIIIHWDTPGMIAFWDSIKKHLM
jgi:hypothetical protein